MVVDHQGCGIENGNQRGYGLDASPLDLGLARDLSDLRLRQVATGHTSVIVAGLRRCGAVVLMTRIVRMLAHMTGVQTGRGWSER